MSDWISSRLDALAEPVNESIDPSLLDDEEIDHYSIPALDLTGCPATEAANTIESNKQPLYGGEVLVSKLNPRKARVFSVPLEPPRRTVCSGEFIVLRPRLAVSRRYLGYLLLSETIRQLLDASVQSVTRSHQRVRPEVLTKLNVSVPPLDEQRAIADYLDTETARIDALITKKRRMIDLLQEAWSAMIESQIRSASLRLGDEPLKRAAGEITVGIVITPAKWYAENGVVALRGMNVSPGRIDTSEVVYLSDEGHRLHRKSELRSGDIVVVRTGQAGAAAVVPGVLDRANCIDLLLIRRSARLKSKYLEYVLNSDWTLKHVAQHSVGTIQSHFNVGALRELPVPVPSVEEQTSIVGFLDRRGERLRRLTTAIESQIDLLVEHRQALITAAVTGELRVPAA